MQIDARDLFIPKPAIMALEALAKLREGEALAVLVNDGKAVDELMRLAEEHHCSFLREDEGDYAVVTLSANEQVKVDDPLREALELMGIAPAGAPTILFGSDTVGSGDDVVGRILAIELLIDFCSQEALPAAIVLYNGGAKLAMKDSPVIDNLVELEQMGVDILVDSVSAEYFESGGGVGVGTIVDPYIIAALLAEQSGVITL